MAGCGTSAGAGRIGIRATTAAFTAGILVAEVWAASAVAEPCLTVVPERVWAENVRRGDEIVLVDGRVVRLAAIETPRAPLGSAEDPAIGRFAAAARAALATAVEGRELELFRIGTDRWGRERAHLVAVDGGDWIQATMVTAGFARVVPAADDRACARALIGEEAPARREGRGLWGLSVFALRDPITVTSVPAGTYVVVEGVVRSVGHSGRRTYLDFGDDFRRDFAIVLDDKVRDGLKAAGFDAERSRGRTVRVRGDLARRDGPRIVVGMPEEIERVER